jgi:hypothetical protein
MANKKNKKKAAQPQQAMSPHKYITSGRPRLLPIHECWIAPNWKEVGMTTIVVSRKHSTGNVTFGIYMVDVFCLGLKNTSVIFSKPEYEYDDIVETIYQAHDGKELIDYTLAHNIIYGSIAYAEDLGFQPKKDWSMSQFILEEDTEDIELIEVEFGQDGKPHYFGGPFDNVGKIISKLEASVGEGNFFYTLYAGGDTDFGDLFEDNDFDEDDFDEDDGTIEDVEHEEIKK